MGCAYSCCFALVNISNNAFIGIDLGTSGCRVIAIDQQAHIIAGEQQAVKAPLSTPPKSEQDPEYQWQAVLNTLSQVIAQCQAYTIQAIAVDATSGSILITDSVGQPLSPILMYNDARAVDQSAQIAKVAPPQSGAHGVSSGLAKLLYLVSPEKVESFDFPNRKTTNISF